MHATLHLVLRLTGGGSSYLPEQHGLGAGGKIVQKIVRDRLPADAYDYENGVRVHITILSPDAFSRLTGYPQLSSPVSMKTYVEAGIPWFKLYDEGIPTANNVSSTHALGNVRSVQSLLTEREAERKRHTCCYCSCAASFEVQPCRHLLCKDCADGLMVNECPKQCQFVTGRTKVSSAAAVAGTEVGPEVGVADEWVIKLSRHAKNGEVATFRLAQDGVSRLSGGRV